MSNEPADDADRALAYWAFISYSHADTAWAAWLHKALERYRVPRQLVGRRTTTGTIPRRLYPTFRDREELPGASSVTAAINDSLARSRFLIVVCSPHAAASKYVNAEITEFKRLGRADRVLCLIVEGEPGASARPESGLLEAFPHALRQEIGAAGTVTDAATEPLAADVRPGRDGRKNALLKLVAAILGVAYDELRQRDRRRQRWRVAQAAAFVVLIVAVTLGIWVNRQRVVEEQRIGQEARQLARDSLDVTDKDAGKRLALALQSVRHTRDRYGYVLSESEVALYRALAEAGLRGSFAEDDTSETFGGWTWPVAISPDASRIVAPSALGPTLLLGADAARRGLLVDRDAPYEHDLAALASRDNEHFITGGADGVVRIWTTDGQLVRRFKAHAADLVSIDLSPDGSHLLTVGCDSEPGYQSCEARSARLWSLSGEPGPTFVHEGGTVTSAAFSPAGDRIVTAGDGTLRSWLRSGAQLFNVAAAPHWMTRASFSPDGTRVLNGGCTPFRFAGMFSPLPTDRRCPGDDAAEVAMFDERGAVVGGMRAWTAGMDPRGARIVTARQYCQVDGTCAHMVGVLLPDGISGGVGGIAADGSVADISFSPAGDVFAVALEHGAITVRDIYGGVVSRLGGFVPGLNSARFSDDGDRLVTVSCSNAHQGACLERSIHVWDPNGPLQQTLPHAPARNRVASGAHSQPSVMRVSPSGGFLFLATEADSPHVRNLDTGRRIELEGAGLVFDAAFAPGDTRLVIVGQRTMQFRDLDGRLLEQHSVSPADGAPAPPIAGWSRGVVAAAGSVVRAWDWDGRPIGDMQGHTAAVTFVSASPALDAVATVDAAGHAIVWDAQLHAVSIHASALNPDPEGGWTSRRFDVAYKIRFTPDGTRVVILGPGSLSMWTTAGRRLWDVVIDPQDEALPEASNDRVLVVVCTQRGRGASLASLRMCYDSTATLWDGGGTIVKRLDAGQADEAIVNAAAFNPAGNRIVTMNRGGATRLWDADGNIILDVTSNASALAFSPRGGRLLTVNAAGTPVRVWQVWDDLDEMLAEAERRARLLSSSTPTAP